jgi:uncharacterized membrane protein YhaH (DUF805 family)
MKFVNGIKRKRIEELAKRKNITPALIVTALFWIAILVLIFLVDPYESLALPGFFILVFLALFFTTTIILGKRRRGILVSFAITLLLMLRYFGIATLLNTLLIIAIASTIEFYFTRQT